MHNVISQWSCNGEIMLVFNSHIVRSPFTSFAVHLGFQYVCLFFKSLTSLQVCRDLTGKIFHWLKENEISDRESVAVFLYTITVLMHQYDIVKCKQ